MDIELPVAKLKKTLGDTLEENSAQNEKIWKLYVQKTNEYAKYLARFSVRPPKLKQEPYLNLEDTKQLRDSLDALRIHVGQTIKIDDGEYRRLLDGVIRLRAGGVAHISTLTSLNYS